MNKKRLLNQVLAISTLAIVGLGCGGDSIDNIPDDEIIVEDEKDKENQLIEVNGKIFNIPSPIQTAVLLESSGANYNIDMLNAPEKVNAYSTNFKKALNLGVYGADLGYVTLYDQTSDALSFLKAIKLISDDLGISNSFNPELLERFQTNLGNKDSLLTLVSDAYKASDRYLKNNQQNDIGALVLAGGWIESLHFACSAVKIASNEDVINRIAEQKVTIENLIRLLKPYYNRAEITTLVDKLEELDQIFDGVNYKFIYEEPTTDIENKITTINSKVEIDISADQLDQISQKILDIRIDIIS